MLGRLAIDEKIVEGVEFRLLYRVSPLVLDLRRWYLIDIEHTILDYDVFGSE
jgi:hypothetical protein